MGLTEKKIDKVFQQKLLEQFTLHQPIFQTENSFVKLRLSSGL